MRVLRTCVYIQFSIHLLAESVFRKHTANSLLDYSLRQLIEHLLRLKWWDWDIDRINKHMDALCSPDLSKIIEMEN